MTSVSGQKTGSSTSRGPILWTIAYLLLASLWIWLTQWLLSEVGGYSWRISTTGLVFGEIFVLVTGGGLFLLLRYFMVPSSELVGSNVRDESAPNGRRWIISLMVVVAVMLIGQVLLSWYAARAYAPSLVEKARADVEALASIRADRIDHWLSLHRRDIEALNDRRDLLTSIAGTDVIHHEALSGVLSGLISDKRFDSITIVDPEHTRKLHMGLASLGAHVPDGLFEQAAATAEARFGTEFVPGSTAINCYWVLPVFLDHSEVSGGPWYLVFRARLNAVSLEQYSRVSAASLFKNSSQWLLQTIKSTVQAPLVLRLAGMSADQQDDSGSQDLPSIQSVDPEKLPAAVRQPLQASDVHAGAATMPPHGPPLISGSGVLNGVSVIYAALPMPAMQAVLLTDIDREQVLAPVTRLEKWLSIGALIGTIAILSALLVLWRLIRRMHDMRLATEMSERDRLLLQFYNLPMIGMAVIDPETLEVERVNQRLAQIYHTDPSALVGTPFDDLVADEDATPIQHTLDQQSVRGLVAGQFDELSLERTVTLPDHVQVCVHMNVRAVRLPSGFVTALVATVDDVTEEKMQAQLLSCQRDLYHMSARTAAALIAVDNPQAMYNDVCRIAVTGTSFTSVCLFLLDSAHQLNLVACDGDNPDCVSAFLGQGAIDVLGREWLDRALTSRQPIFLSDLSSTSLPASSVSWGRRHRLHALAMLPLEHEGHVSGALILGSRTTGLWTESVRKVLSDLAGQLARAQAALDTQTRD